MNQSREIRGVRLRRVLWWGSVGVLSIGLLGSMTANVLIDRQGTAEYREMKHARLDPMGLRYDRFPPELPAGAKADEPLVVFFGDSRAQAWWPPPQVIGWRFANRGIYGQTTAEVAGRLSAQVLSLHPRAIVLQAGINDLTAIGVLPEKREGIVNNCTRNLRDIIRRCSQTGATVIVTTIFPVGPVPLMKRPLWSPEIDQAVLEVNEDLRSIHEPNVVLLDAFNLLQDGGRMRAGYSLDTLHARPEAYAVLNEQLRQVLSASSFRTTQPARNAD